MKRDFLPAFFLGVSLYGLAVAMLLTLYPPVISEETTLRKPLLGLLFALICLGGMTAALFPGPCSEKAGLKKSRTISGTGAGFARKKFGFRGHHPDCGKFSSHVFHVGNRALCAGCTGLFIGAMINLAGTFLYFFAGFSPGNLTFLILWLGAAGVVLGLLSPLLFPPWWLARSLANAFFAPGAFLLVVGVDDMSKSLTVGLSLLALTLFWILNRLYLSRWSHRKICRACDDPGCDLRDF
ncbi:MAG: hypothetical protein ACP5PX_04775 [Candidatus Hadarchaeum sp.]|uniref:hypothetical protein n=1 Tax=Candidatus Hadarchaeum sp. TaxID=2883567 RepID=UPI003D12A12C